MNYWKIRKF